MRKKKAGTGIPQKKSVKILPIFKIAEAEILRFTTLSRYRNSSYQAPFDFDNKISLTAEGNYLIQGHNGYYLRESMSLLVDKDFRINNFACTCPESQESSGQKLCPHLNTLIRKINELCLPLQDLPYHPEIEDTDFPPLLSVPKGETLAQRKERLHLQKLALDAQTTHLAYLRSQDSDTQVPLFSLSRQTENEIELIACLHYEMGTPHLSFQIAGVGTYKIKQIPRFLDRIRSGANYRYGQKLEFVHTLEAFTPTARKLIAVLNKVSELPANSSSIPLFWLDLDALYDIFSENADLLIGMELNERMQLPDFEILPLENNYYELRYPQNFSEIVIYSQHAYFFTTADHTLVRVYCPDISALHTLSLLVHRSGNVVFRQSLYSEISSLVQRVNGEVPSDSANLRYKLDIERQNIRIHVEGNTNSTLGQAVHNALISSGAALKNNNYYFGGIDQDLLNQLTEKLGNYGEVWVSDELKAYHRTRKAPSNIHVRQSGNLLTVDINSPEFDRVETVAILKSFRRKKTYHKLKNGETIKLDPESWQNLSDFLEDQGISLSTLEKDEISLPMYHLFSMTGEQEMTIDFAPDLTEKLDYFHDHGSHSFPLPAAIASMLKPYQAEGVQFLKLLEALDLNGILADDMGLGKTVQTLTLLSEATDKTSLIICPASLIYNWRDEVAKFFPNMNAAYILGEREERMKILQSAEQYQLIITSYDYLLRDIEEMRSIPFYYVVLDESQRIKNMQTKSAKAAKRLNSQHRLALSGTPIENNPAELWSVFDFLMPGYLYSYSRFRKKFELPIVRNQDEAAAKELSRMVKPFVLRRLKKEVLNDLPEKYEITLSVTPTAEEKRVYQAHEASVKHEIANLLEDTQSDVGIEILALLTRLRLLCCDRSLIEEGVTTVGSKVKTCVKTITDLRRRNQQVLVFSSFTKVLDLLAFELKKIGISHHILQGSTPKEKRHELVSSFQKGNFSVFLISLKTGGTGLNLTEAQAVIHFDPWWNKAAMNQATDRAYRIGQKQSVEVYSLLVSGTIEERIFELQNKKWALAEQLIGGESQALTGMSREEVMKLFT